MDTSHLNCIQAREVEPGAAVCEPCNTGNTSGCLWRRPAAAITTAISRARALQAVEALIETGGSGSGPHLMLLAQYLHQQPRDDQSSAVEHASLIRAALDGVVIEFHDGSDSGWQGANATWAINMMTNPDFKHVRFRPRLERPQ